MFDLLEEKRTQLQHQLENPLNHEEEIAQLVAEYEQKIRNEFKKQDEERKSKLLAQIDVVDELIKENSELEEQTEEAKQDLEGE